MANKASVLLAAVLISAGTAAASAKTPSGHSETATNSVDKMFTTKVAMGGTAEIALSKIALSRSNTPAVKRYAAQMIKEHTIMGGALAITAHDQGLPAPMVLDAMHQGIKAKLMHLSGKSLDKAYMSAMISDHAKTVDMFQDEIAHGENFHVTNLATKNVAAIQNHLLMARDITGTEDKPSKIVNPSTSHM